MAIGVCGFLLLAGCSERAETTGKSHEQIERRFVSVGTAPPGGAFFVVGSAVADVVGRHTAERGWQVTAEATKGTQENIHRLAKGEIDFALANAAITYFAVRGEGKWERPYPIKSVMTLAPNVALFITPASSGIESISDLRGRRVVVGPAGAGFDHFIQPILAAHGLTYDDIRPLHDTQGGAVALLADGSADAAFLGGAVPTASITQACAGHDIHFIPFDAEAVEQLVADYSFFQRKTIPAGTYKGQAEDFHGLNVGSMILVTSDRVNDDTVRLFTETLFENGSEVVERHPAGKAINAKNVARDTGTPFHPGAVNYYRDKGVWAGEGRAPGTVSGGGGPPPSRLDP